jgi:uncharacterized membrane protein YfcA
VLQGQLERNMTVAFPGLTVAILLLVVGLLVGIISGMVGIGGGILVIPILMIAFGFSQTKANGTSMAMLLPPIGIFAVMSYWRASNVDLAYAAFLAVGFAIGAYIGAMAVNSGRINEVALRILFSIVLLYVAGRMLFRPGGRARAALEITLLIASFLISYVVMRLLGQKLNRVPNWSEEYRKRRHMALDYDYEI